MQAMSVKLMFFALTSLYLVVALSSADPVRPKQDYNSRKGQETVDSWSKSSNSSNIPSGCANFTCTLNFKDDDVDVFQSKIFDEEALAVFLYVTMSNTTSVKVKPESFVGYGEQGKFVPHSLQLKEKWAWIRNSRAKFLATLPYDVDILSLTTLTKDVYNLILTVNSTPTDCYLNFTKECLKAKIAGALMNLTEHLGSVCFKVENAALSLNDHGYKCCHIDKHGFVLCDRSINDNIWVRFALSLLWDISFAFGLLSPLLLKYLPKEFHRRGKQRSRPGMRRADSLASYDSIESSIVASKVLISKGDGLLDIARSTTQSTVCSRFSRCLFVFLLSLLPIVQTLLYVYLKNLEVGISDELLGLGSAFLTLLGPSGKKAILAVYCFCIVLVAIAMAIPKTLSDLARKLSGKRDEQTFLGFKKPEVLLCHSEKRGFQLMYENMIFHLNCLMMLSFWKFVWSVLMYPLHLLCHCDGRDIDGVIDEEDEEYIDMDERQGLGKKILRGLSLLFIFPIWLVIITTAFFLYLLPVTYVAFRIWKMLFRFEVECPCCDGIPMPIKMLSLPLLYILFIVFCICVEGSYFMLVLVISINLVFLGSVVGFTTMGVLFYIDAYISYVVVIILGCYYVVRAFHEFKVHFKRVKVIIFTECQDHDNELKTEASIRDTFSAPAPSNLERSSSTSSLQKLAKGLALVTCSDERQIPSIPLQLFLQAQKEVFPFKRVIISELVSLLMIFTYLVLIFSFVMSLVEYDAANSIVQAIAILLLGAVPSLFQSKPNEIPEKEEKWIKFHVREQIRKYCKQFA